MSSSSPATIVFVRLMTSLLCMGPPHERVKPGSRTRDYNRAKPVTLENVVPPKRHGKRHGKRQTDPRASFFSPLPHWRAVSTLPGRRPAATGLRPIEDRCFPPAGRPTSSPFRARARTATSTWGSSSTSTTPGASPPATSPTPTTGPTSPGCTPCTSRCAPAIATRTPTPA